MEIFLKIDLQYCFVSLISVLLLTHLCDDFVQIFYFHLITVISEYLSTNLKF